MTYRQSKGRHRPARDTARPGDPSFLTQPRELGHPDRLRRPGDDGSMAPKRSVLVAFALFALATPSAASPNRDFPLGQSATGAVCEATQEFDDPAIQLRGARAWSIHCRGYTAIFGRLYAFERDGAKSIASDSVWHAGLGDRAKCAAEQSASIAGLNNVKRAACQSVPGGVAYSVYTIENGDSAAVAEGFQPLTDLIEAGLKIVTDAAPVPESALQTQPGGEYGVRQGGETASFTAAVDAAQQTTDWLKNRAHVENQGFLFEDAERDFRSLAAAGGLVGKDRVIAELNVALNVSNQGRFAEADKLFEDAAKTESEVHDPVVDALTLNYEALHLLNQRKFADAEKTAEEAIAARDRIDPEIEARASAAKLDYQQSGNEMEISPLLAEQLNERENATGFQVTRLTPTEKLRIQNAQAEFVVGVSKIERGQGEAGRQALEAVNTVLEDPRLARSGAFLHAETLGALGRLDLTEKKLDTAEDEFVASIRVFENERNLVASPAQATLYLGLGQSEVATGQADKALQDYKTGFELFRESHRPLGDAKNAAGPFFDLLIDRIAKDPAHAREDEDEFFNVTQIVVGQATAQTLAQLSARVSAGDARSSLLARQLDDTQRQIAIKVAEIKREQDAGANPQADQTELAALDKEAETLEQQLLTANPRYGQVIEEAATLDKMQAALGPGEIYVKTVALADKGFGIAITHDSVNVYAIPLSRNDVIDRVKKLRLPFDGEYVTRFDVPLAHALYAAVFGPVADKVKAARHLIYEPDSLMVSLPAAVFVTDDASVASYNKLKAQDPNGRLDLNLYENTAWLGRNVDISLAVSATAFLQTRAIKPSKANEPFLAFGDPVTKGGEANRYALLVDKNDPATAAHCEKLRELWATKGPGALEGIAETIRTVGQDYSAAPSDMILGQSFTDQSVLDRKDLAHYRVVFFGTHAVLPSNNACLPEAVLVTSLGGKDSDGFLDESEILRLNMDADMVVLAACDTGGQGATETDRTGLTGSGDELSGLARDFIYAGARTLVVSQWQVDSAATSAMMSRLFGAGSTTQADALRKAELALMDHKETAHPYYWAGFTLVGDGARALPGPAHTAVATQ